jgi:hypothetical protein
MSDEVAEVKSEGRKVLEVTIVDEDEGGLKKYAEYSDDLFSE